MSASTVSTTTSEFDYVRDLVHRHAGVVLDEDQRWLVNARLERVVAQSGVQSVSTLIGRLQCQPFNELHRSVVESLMTHETYFFRDFSPFQALRHTVVPELIKAREATRTLRIWSAACSSGQEPYSVAMLLREYFPSLDGWNVQILASDLSTEMIGRAVDGYYNQIEVNRGLPAPLLVKYFEQQEGRWRIREEIRRMVEFREINLTGQWPAMGAFDIVLLRNVLIYFDLDTKKTILERLRDVLSQSGFLFLGSAETTLYLDEAYHISRRDKVIFYRLGADRATRLTGTGLLPRD